MNLIKISAFIFLILFAVSCKAVPKIHFEITEHDFGEQKMHQKIKHIFKFKNTGNSLLIIEKVRAG